MFEAALVLCFALGCLWVLRRTRAATGMPTWMLLFVAALLLISLGSAMIQVAPRTIGIERTSYVVLAVLLLTVLALGSALVMALRAFIRDIREDLARRPK